MAHVIQVGCGNIGSHVAGHLARVAQVDEVTLIDRDTYDGTNLWNQDILARDVGRSKARVLARRLRSIHKSLIVHSIGSPVEDVPLGRLRGDLILACLDSRRARQTVNQIAWRLGIPWIDSGVEAGGGLARINSHRAASGDPCLECAWDDADYENLEVDHPCAGGKVEGKTQEFRTGGSSALGALAASLQALECHKFFEGHQERMLFGRQLVVDSAYHRHYVSSFQANPECRFDHQTWRIEDLPESSRTLGDSLALARGGNAGGTAWLRVEGQHFATALTCTGCGGRRSSIRLEVSLRGSERTCRLCGARMAVRGWDMVSELTDQLPERTLNRTLRRIGLRNGDVASVGVGGEQDRERHFVIGPPEARVEQVPPTEEAGEGSDKQ